MFLKCCGVEDYQGHKNQNSSTEKPRVLPSGSRSLILPARILLCSGKASPPGRLPPPLTVLDLTHILAVATQAVSTSPLSSSGHKSKSRGCDCSTQEPARLATQDGQPATPRSAHGHLEPQVFSSAQGSRPAQTSLGFLKQERENIL